MKKIKEKNSILFVKKIFILGVVIFALSGCGNKDYYSGTTIKKLKTFTSLTCIELNISQKNSTGTTYSYMMDKNADNVGAIMKYESYIRDLGFERNEELEKIADNNSKVYVMNGYLISLTEIEEGNIIHYIITIPEKSLLEDDSSKNEEDNDELYKQLIDLASQGKYQEAYDFYYNSNLSEKFEGYSDSKKYMFYSQAMIGYENGGLGYAYSMLKEWCNDVLDAPKIINELDETLGKFNGIYKATMNGANFYIYIKDGKVAYDMKSVYLDDGSLRKPIYLYYLIEIAYDTGEKTLGIGDVTSGKVRIDYAFVGSYTSNGFTSIAWQGQPTTYNGVYTKISDSTEY